jgi:hypothetical protein
MCPILIAMILIAQSRKAEVAKFRLNTGHDLLGKHLKRFNIVDSDICNVEIQDRAPEELLHIAG